MGRHFVRAHADVHEMTGLDCVRPEERLDMAWVEQDLTQPLDGTTLPRKVDVIVHLAQSPFYKNFPDKADHIFEVNVHGTLRLLEYARSAQCKRFVLASTGGVYGFGDHPFKEAEAIALPAVPGFYPATKMSAELLAANYAAYMDLITLRFFFVYGEGQARNMLVPRLIHSVLEGRSIQLQGADGLRINPTYVGDAVSAMARSCELEGSHIINVGGPENLSLRQMACHIGHAAQKTPVFEVQEREVAHQLVGDIGEMKRLLGEPKIRFEEGVERAVSASVSEPG